MNCESIGIPMHIDLTKRFCITQIVLMNPIIPHTSEYIWKDILLNSSLIYHNTEIYTRTIFNPSAYTYSESMLSDWDNLSDLSKQAQSTIIKNSKKKNWCVGKIIFRYNLKYFDIPFVQDLFEKITGYPVQIENLDRPRQYFIFS